MRTTRRYSQTLAQKTNDTHKTLQADLTRAAQWSRKWLMQLNLDKCKVMHFDYGNPKHDYHVVNSEGGVTTLEKTVAERDLGVIVCRHETA